MYNALLSVGVLHYISFYLCTITLFTTMQKSLFENRSIIVRYQKCKRQRLMHESRLNETNWNDFWNFEIAFWDAEIWSTKGYPENSLLLHKGKYQWMADVVFVLLGYSCFSHAKLVTYLLVWLNQNQSNRRSAVQWYFPLWSKWVLTGLSIVNVIIQRSTMGVAWLVWAENGQSTTTSL